MNRREKLDLYRKVLIGLGKGLQMAAFLAEEERLEERDAVDEKNEALAGEAARLRREIHSAWSADYAELKAEIARVNDGLQDDLRDIERKIRIADKVILALGKLDRLIAAAQQALA